MIINNLIQNHPIYYFRYRKCKIIQPIDYLQQFQFFEQQKQIIIVCSNLFTEIQCQIPGRTKLTDYLMENTHKQVEIIMSEFMSKSDGIISLYISFKIETKPIGWIVNTRFTDFLKLREILVMTLQSLYPSHLIPPIPGKKWKSQTGSGYLEKRMRIMELFLQNCLYHPLYKTHPLFSDFLKISDDSKLKEKLCQIILKIHKIYIIMFVNCVQIQRTQATH